MAKKVRQKKLKDGIALNSMSHPVIFKDIDSLEEIKVLEVVRTVCCCVLVVIQTSLLLHFLGVF